MAEKVNFWPSVFKNILYSKPKLILNGIYLEDSGVFYLTEELNLHKFIWRNYWFFIQRDIFPIFERNLRDEFILDFKIFHSFLS